MDTLGNYGDFHAPSCAPSLKWFRRDAEAMYKPALAVDPHHVDNLCNYGDFLAPSCAPRLKRFRRDAEAIYQRAQAEDPLRVETLHLDNVGRNFVQARTGCEPEPCGHA